MHRYLCLALPNFTWMTTPGSKAKLEKVTTSIAAYSSSMACGSGADEMESVPNPKDMH